MNWAFGLGNGGDIKNNSVCVKEMSMIDGFSNQRRVELVDPIYPQGLMGNQVANSKYQNHPKEFPNTRRHRITKSQLKENIKNQFSAYASEEFILPGTNNCVKHRRSIDRVSDSELAMMVAFSQKTKFDNLRDLPLQEMIKKAEIEFAGAGDLTWRESLAQELTEDYIYETLVGSYQQKFVRDGFSVGGVLGFAIAAVLIVGGTILGIILSISSGGAAIPFVIVGGLTIMNIVNDLVSSTGTTYNTSNNASSFINQFTTMSSPSSH